MRIAITTIVCLLMISPTWAAEKGKSKAPQKPAKKKSGFAGNFRPTRTVQYKKVGGVTLSLHVFEPAGHKSSDKRPAIVFFFGGGWNGGSPGQFYSHCAYLASRGMWAASAEYRVKSKHKTPPSACVQDGKSAVRYIRANASKLGIDPNKLASGGGSAGGHVSAATATVTKFDEPGEDTSVSAVPNASVLFNPVYDNSEKGYGHSRVKDYWKDISPMHNIRKGVPPAIVFLGDKDKLIPVSTAEEYRDLMKAAGARSDLHVYKGQPHGFFNFGRGDSYFDTIEKMDAFLADLGFLKGKPTITKEFGK